MAGSLLLLSWNLGHFLSAVLDKKALREATCAESGLFLRSHGPTAHTRIDLVAVDAFFFIRPANWTGSHFLREARAIDGEEPLPSYAFENWDDTGFELRCPNFSFPRWFCIPKSGTWFWCTGGPHTPRNVLIFFGATGPPGPRDFLNVTTGNRGVHIGPREPDSSLRIPWTWSVVTNFSIRVHESNLNSRSAQTEFIGLVS